MLSVGDEAPDFEAVNQQGQHFHLGDHRGKWVVLYFYPKDDTPGCTAEACAFRDSMEELASSDVEVVGVSTQSVESHQVFAEKHRLNFALLADEDKKVCRLYDTLGILGLSRRVTYIIDPEGLIADVYRREVRPRSHVERVRERLGHLRTNAQ